VSSGRVDASRGGSRSVSAAEARAARLRFARARGTTRGAPGAGAREASDAIAPSAGESACYLFRNVSYMLDSWLMRQC